MSGTRRPWVAAALAFIYPGLGHVYLREWFRAMLWFGIGLTTAVLVLEGVLDTSSVAALVASLSTLSLGSTLAVSAVRLFSMIDAYMLADRTRTRAAPAATATTAGQCPHCGRELEEGLDFCHWCTEPLPGASDADAP